MKKRMRLKNKCINRGTVYLFICLLIIIYEILIFKYVNNNVIKYLISYTEYTSKRINNITINESIDNVLNKSTIDENVGITKNDNDIVSVDFNTIEINKKLILLNTTINEELEKNNKDLYKERINLNVLNNGEYPLVSYLGPKIPFMISEVGDISSNIKTELNEYGINNVLIKVYLDVEITERIMIPFFKDTIKTSNQVLLYMKLIEGKIPDVYGGNYSVSSPLSSINLEE